MEALSELLNLLLRQAEVRRLDRPHDPVGEGLLEALVRAVELARFYHVLIQPVALDLIEPFPLYDEAQYLFLFLDGVGHMTCHVAKCSEHNQTI